MTRLARWAMLWILAALAGAAIADDGVRVVYHLVDGTAQATRAMQNIRNHLDADPAAKIVVVGHGAGIDFLLDGATDAKGQPFAGPIGELATAACSSASAATRSSRAASRRGRSRWKPRSSSPASRRSRACRRRSATPT